MKHLAEYIIEQYHKKEAELLLEKSNQKAFLKQYSGTFRQVIENWILVRYCDIIGGYEGTRYAWIKELKKQMHNMCSNAVEVADKNWMLHRLVSENRFDDPVVLSKIMLNKIADEAKTSQLKKMRFDRNVIDDAVDDFIDYGLEECIIAVSKASTHDALASVDRYILKINEES